MKIPGFAPNFNQEIRYVVPLDVCLARNMHIVYQVRLFY